MRPRAEETAARIREPLQSTLDAPIAGLGLVPLPSKGFENG